MLFIETRGNDGVHPASLPFSEAILAPVASFGGIYSPQNLPSLDRAFLEQHLTSSYKQLASAILSLFELDLDSQVVQQALDLYDRFDDTNNPVPLVKVKPDLYVCELYHGPTRAFKDMALQPFGLILSALAQQRGQQYLILAATSGDTGPAALETFRDRANIRVVCLYPDGGTSDVQRLQMVTESAQNLKVIGIQGNFDDAQSALKSLLGSASFKQQLARREIAVSAANSVNFGRILFQIIYHIHAYLELRRQQAIAPGDKVYLNIPSGNFGNALGAYYARKMGLPVERIIIASNANNVLTDWITSGSYDIANKTLVQTSSPAMDILKSSNVERILFDLFGAERTRELMRQLDQEQGYQLSAAELEQLQQIFVADFCSDQEGEVQIQEAFKQGYLIDPHTATCFKAHQSLKLKPLKHVVYATAEWTKFSPFIDQAITGNRASADLEALESIASAAGIEIPTQISALFGKQIAQSSVVSKDAIEPAILQFLDA